MGRKEVYLFIAGTAIETTGMGLGMSGVISAGWGIAIAVVGIVIFAFAAFRFFTIKTIHPTWQELQAGGEGRRKDLEHLQEAIEKRLAAYKELAEKAITLQLEKYNDKYFGIKAPTKRNIFDKMTKRKFWLNNRYYRELKNATDMNVLDSEYQKRLSNIIDKKLKDELRKLWGCEHQAKSNEIYYEINRMNFKGSLSKDTI